MGRRKYSAIFPEGNDKLLSSFLPPGPAPGDTPADRGVISGSYTAPENVISPIGMSLIIVVVPNRIIRCPTPICVRESLMKRYRRTSKGNQGSVLTGSEYKVGYNLQI